MGVRERVREFKKYIKITKADTIARRYFIMNSFDGIVTILGILTGSLITGLFDPIPVIGISISTAIALVVSGFSGTLIAEMSEREIERRQLEESMLIDLRNSIYDKAIKTAIAWVGIVDALSPLVAILVSITPLIFSIYNLIDSVTALYMGITICIIYLGGIGAFMGRMLKKNLLIEALKFIGIGLFTTVIISIILNPLRM